MYAQFTRRLAVWLQAAWLLLPGFLCFWAPAGVAAQNLSGPVYACPDCDQRRFRPDPQPGMWFNPQQSGTGLTFTVRNHYLVGTWYGYTDTGEPQWLLFNGPLRPGATPEVLWVLDADLQRYQGGSCPTCAYQAPVSPDIVGRIYLEFDQVGHARYQVTVQDEISPMQNIIPLTFGYGQYTPVAGGWSMPDLHAQWLVVYRQANDDGGTIIPSVLEFGPTDPLTGENSQTAYGANARAATGMETYVDSAEVVCQDWSGAPGFVQTPDPACHYRVLQSDVLAVSAASFFVPAGQILHNRLAGELYDDQWGYWLVEALRISPALQAPPSTLESLKLSPVPPPPPGPIHRIMPTDGMWYNPEEPGSGFTFYFENNRIGGAYYGYGRNGEPLWLVFSAPMEVGDRAAHVNWTVEADLFHYRGGACLGCAYQSPESPEAVGRINIRFTQMGKALFDLEWQQESVSGRLVPGTFGGISWFAPDPNWPIFRSPHMDGKWLLVLKQLPVSYPEYLFALWNYQVIVVDMDAPQLSASGPAVRVTAMSVAQEPPPGNEESTPVLAELWCDRYQELAFYSQPTCRIQWYGSQNLSAPFSGGMEFPLYIEDLDEDHFFAEAEAGHYVEGFKVVTEQVEIGE